MYAYECACVYMHFLSCFYAKSNLLSYFLVFKFLLRQWEPGFHSPQHVYSLFQYKDSPKRSVILLSAVILSTLFPQTQHTPLPPSMWHLLLILPLQLPMQLLSPNTPASPHPPPKMLLSLSRMARDRKVGREEDHWAFSLMDLRIVRMFPTTRMHLCLMNKSFFSLHLLSFTLLALPTSLQGCISV